MILLNKALKLSCGATHLLLFMMIFQLIPNTVAAVQESEKGAVLWKVKPVGGRDPAPHGFREIDGIENIELMRVTPETGTYSHHAHIFHDGHIFYATWSNHLKDEDGPGQRVLYSISNDGRQWIEPRECFPPMGPLGMLGAEGRVLTANGLHQIGGIVYAIAGVNDIFGEDIGEDNRIIHGNLAREIRSDGSLGPMFWLTCDVPNSFDGSPSEIPGAGDPRFAAEASQLLALRYRPENIPSWSFFPGGKYGDEFTVATGYWKSFGGTMRAKDGTLMTEPTAYRRPDGIVVRLFRALASNGKPYRVYTSLFNESERRWTTPVQTGIPDTGSRSVAGRLPNGGIYLVGNQTWKAFERKQGPRDPLVLSVSRDGVVFDHAWVIRSDVPERRYPGKHKGPGFQYPHATVVDDDLWVLYSINKEDMAVSRIPLKTVLDAMKTKVSIETEHRN